MTATAEVGRTDQLLEAQKRVLEMIVRDRPLPEILDALCRIVEDQAERAVRAAILLVTEDGRHLVSAAAPSLPAEYCRAIDGVAIDPDVGTCAAAAARREVVVTPAIATAPSWAALRHLPLGIGLEAAWSMPIVSSDGRVLGTFGTYFPVAREPIDQERRLVEVLARTAALAIERRRSDAGIRASASRHRFLADLTAATQPLIDPAEVMAVTARLLAEHLDVDRCAYAEVEDQRTFVITGDFARGVPSIVGRWEVDAFGPGCVEAMLAGAPYVVVDAEDDPRIGPEHRPAFHATRIRAVICVPLQKDGRFTAAMAVHQQVPRSWTDPEIELVTLVVARCWEALERARVTRNLRDSEARYRAIVEASPECVKVVAADGTLLQMNAAGLAMLETDEGSAIGSSIYEVIAPEHREAFRAFNERVCQGTGGTLEFELVGGTGTRRSMESTAVPLTEPSGRIRQLAVTRDVTARVAAARALEESRARLDYAVRLSGVGFWYCDLPFDELVWDDRVKEHFGLPPGARVTMSTFYARIHPDDRAHTRQAIDTSIADHAPYDVDYRTVDPVTGVVKWIRAIGGTAYAADGTPVRFDGLTVDATVRKRDEERLAQLLDREREQARVLNQVAEAALTIHGAGTLEGVLRVVTEQARRIIGAERAVARVPSDDGLLTVCSPDPDPLASPDPAEAAEVCRTNRPMRTTAGAGWLAVPLVGRAGANLGLVQLFQRSGPFADRDEAILVQLAQIAAVAIDNVRLYDELRSQDRRKNEFLATLAHELRNPLAPIRTGLQVLQLTSDRGESTRIREMMERQVGHMVRMVDDLLDLSRITRGKVTLRRERVELRAVLDSALETTRPLLQSGAHRITVELPEEPIPLEVDPTRLAQVLSNLLNNAVKYTPAGGAIRISAERDGERVAVRVSDTGVGIAPEMLPVVFDMFTQVALTERSQGGLGVGLTLVRSLVEMHGGSVEAESPGPDLGSTFTVRLPLATGDDRAATATRAEPAGSACRILVVDDNADGAESLALLLSLGGHETRTAHSGPEALALAAEFGPDVVLLDIGLPGMDGYEVARRLRATMSVPLLVALTGWGTEADRLRARAAGFDHHLVKPMDPAVLGRLLAQVRPAVG